MNILKSIESLNLLKGTMSRRRHLANVNRTWMLLIPITFKTCTNALPFMHALVQTDFQFSKTSDRKNANQFSKFQF